eukprot:Blabericola_migrator_1__11286@NODE_665_length_6969_cov_168_040568_g485_i0_p2_GENE_NODE_665_length_6969_cov_168_040568_g485_i0NODE_665_length_6969_cov_168_040568_g485_i0_p2_ORF_typecomplete_len668_score116_45Peptidase_M24/PF00557_24/1_6e45Creatinase_N_2/PF16189_5/6_5Creatinase_N_2/PF16189_5/5_9e36Creatinase_N/PF01321_18/2e22Creatinase_N/PF01321_18/0_00026Peptidase_M24_C/PF16188_5/1e04Peptidase_M24_C/PF16188_5/2e18MutS_I/PF01624_20/0_14_NODE_665_length_6969_cov_168_040568_g485_i049056908
MMYNALAILAVVGGTFIKAQINFAAHRQLTMTPYSASVKLGKLREHMKKHELDLYIVPSGDAHVSEVPVAADMRRRYITNFTGSAGTAIIGLDKAYLYTDGRYFLQAERQLDAEFYTLMRANTPGCPKPCELIKSLNVKRVGYDPYLHTKAFIEDYQGELKGTETKLVAIHKGSLKDPETGVEEGQLNLVDLVWEEEGCRPPYPSGPLETFAEQYQGATVSEKLVKVRESMKEDDVGVLILSALDDVAYLYNLRGNDTEEAREFVAYAIVTTDKAYLYLKNHDVSGRVPSDCGCQLGAAKVEVRCYDEVGQDLARLIKELDVKLRVHVDSNVNLALTTVAKSAVDNNKDRIITKKAVVAIMKAVKNQAEVRGMIDCHIQDGFALTRFLAYLESLSPEKLAEMTEVDVSDVLESMRAERPGFLKVSFDTISAVDSNGAVIHYKAEAETAKAMNPRGMYLVDSGGQYIGGTTDVTRTIHLGIPQDFERDLYTRVLIGHVELAKIVFPPKIYGCQLDILARAPLWSIGMDYRHGTGHGVGSSLAVHEGPPNISFRCPPASIDVPFQPGMVVSNEPGCYIDGQFGIRIENMQVCVERRTPHNFDGQTYLGFEQLTLVPYCRKLIKLELLSPEQIRYIDSYHAYIKQVLTPMAGDDQAFVSWLAAACAPLVA